MDGTSDGSVIGMGNRSYMIVAMDKEQWKELWIRKQAKDRGAIERAINVISGKIEGAMDEKASDGSGSKSDRCYKRSN